MKIKTGRSRSAKDFSGAMTDISFLLIIFFLVTTIFMTTDGLLLKLPATDAEPQRLHLNEVLLIEIVNSDEYIVNRGATVNRSGLSGQIRSGVERLIEPVLVLFVTGEVSYQHVLEVLEISRDEGISKFSIQYKDGDPRGLSIDEEAS